MTKPNSIAAMPKPVWSQMIVACKIDNPVISEILEVKVGSITQITVARLSTSAKMLRNPCSRRFLFWVLIL
jgi:hypothetical protein